MKKILSLAIFIIALTGCKKDNDPNDYLIDGYAQDYYYESEIFKDEYLDIYGKWKIYSISGGYDGGGYEPNFDYIEIKKYGMYGIIANNSIVEFGKITIEEQTDESLLVWMIDADSSSYYMDWPEKYVILKETDSLILSSPCCDFYQYDFVREE